MSSGRRRRIHIRTGNADGSRDGHDSRTGCPTVDLYRVLAPHQQHVESRSIHAAVRRSHAHETHFRAIRDATNERDPLRTNRTARPRTARACWRPTKPSPTSPSTWAAGILPSRCTPTRSVSNLAPTSWKVRDPHRVQRDPDHPGAELDLHPVRCSIEQRSRLYGRPLHFHQQQQQQ